MYTFEEQYKLAQRISKDYSSSQLALFKLDINNAAAQFLNRFGTKTNRGTTYTDVKAGQQYYQFAYECLRPSHIRVQNSTFWYSPELITSEDQWNKINAIEPTATFPIFWYIRGYREVGLYPTPSQNETKGLELTFQPEHIEMTEDDYKAGTVTVTNGSTTLTHSNSGFTPNMVGRWLQITDGTDGRWYRISAYVSSSTLTLENYFEGISGAGRTFRLGQIMQIPQGYQEAPVYDALKTYYLGQKDKATAIDFDNRFESKLKLAKATYGKSTTSSGVRKNDYLKRKPRWIDLTPPVGYP